MSGGYSKINCEEVASDNLLIEHIEPPKIDSCSWADAIRYTNKLDQYFVKHCPEKINIIYD